MSGLESMSALSEANTEADTRQKMDSPQLWRRLELYRLARSTSREDEQKRREMVLCLLKDVEIRLLFVAADLSYQQTGDEVKRRAVNTALVSVFESSVGPELFQVRSFSPSKSAVIIYLGLKATKLQRASAFFSPFRPFLVDFC